MRRFPLALVLLGLLLSACSASLPLAVDPTSPPKSAPTATPSPTGTPRPTATISPSATDEPIPSSGCPHTAGRIVESEVHSDALIRPLPYLLYLPPCYDAAEARGYPLLILLHGLTGDSAQWLEIGLPVAADQLIASGEVEPFLIAMPWHRTGIEIEPAVLEVLIPALERDYHALPGRTWRAIGGISRGAGWALQIGFRHPDHFRTVGLHSPAVFSGEMSSLAVWAEGLHGLSEPRLWIDIGDRDPLLGSTEELSERLTELRIDHIYRVEPGDHSIEYWSAQIREYLSWYADRW